MAENSLVVLNKDFGYPTVDTNGGQNPVIQYPGFGAKFQFKFNISGNLDADATDSVAIISTNEFMVQAIIDQYFIDTATLQHKFFVTQAPIDPGIPYTLLGKNINLFILQLKQLLWVVNGLPKERVQWRIQTNQTSFGDVEIVFYFAVGNTLNKSEISLASFITNMSQLQTIANFPSPIDLVDAIGFSLKPRNGPTVGASIETLNGTLWIA